MISKQNSHSSFRPGPIPSQEIPYLPQPDSHDLSLPAWGPYTKKYNGIAHIPDVASGLRFDLSVFPGYYRHHVTVPHSNWESGYHPWEAAPGLSFFSYRYDLEWKDRVYCDVAFFADPDEPDAPGASARVVRCEFVNHTDLPQHTVLHYMASMNFPPVRPYSEEAVLPADAILPLGARWIDALDYGDLRYAVPRPSDTLVYEGWLRGEVREHGFVNGTGIGSGFGRDAGDCVWYPISVTKAFQDALLLVRYRAPDGALSFELKGVIESSIQFEPSEAFVLCSIPLGLLVAGEYRLELISKGGAGLELDGFVLLESALRDQVHFAEHSWKPVPELEPGPAQNSLLLHYPEVDCVYGLAWGGDSSQVREFFTGELDRTLPYYVLEHVQTRIYIDDRGHFTNVFIRPIVLAAHSKTVLYGLVCSGSMEEVRVRLAGFDPRSSRLEEAYTLARGKIVSLAANPSGEAFRFSQERMAATLLTNVVYPVYTRRSFIRHFTPGKRWDCLYTWDSGFISMGLLPFDLARGIDCLNAYTTPPGDPQAAFIHHGSPVPVQIYAFQELWNRTRSRELLEYFYPRLRQQYLFLAGRLGSSTTRPLKSNLLKTWDYFYNSAGWDDYPPQVKVHHSQLEATVTPVVTTAHAIRTAKILQQAARALGLSADVPDYQADIDTWSASLNRSSWDEDAGVFSYVIHDADGSPVEPLRHTSGQNYNLGLDGISPLFAGICSAEQESRIIARMSSPEHMWSPVGLVSVDPTAAYYRADGYWNGAVWYPYQWFSWKALLDQGRGDFAFQIASTALELWKTEVGETYNCFEHFIVASRRATGWHHFGALSAPILAWFCAYHTPGTLTCGFDTWIEQLKVGPDCTSLRAELRHSGADRPWLALVVLAARREYTVTWNGRQIEPLQRHAGMLEIMLDGSGVLDIQPVEPGV